jgi:hypothetical protein
VKLPLKSLNAEARVRIDVESKAIFLKQPAEAYKVVRPRGSHIVWTIGSQLTARYWLLVAVLTVQFVPHRKHTPSP